MDATRPRRTQDAARQRWYAQCRCVRFARHFEFPVLVVPPLPPRLLPDNPPAPSANASPEDGITVSKDNELTIAFSLPPEETAAEKK